MKRFATILLALVMILSLAVPAFAAEGSLTGGSITINKAVVGQDYSAYQILYLESYNAASGAYAYKANTAWEAWLKTQTTYVSFDDQGYVTWVDGADVKAFAKLAQAELTGKTADATATATSETVVLNNLNLGYYLVDTTLGTLCSLDTTNPNVVMEEKNEAPTVAKEVQEDSDDSWGATNDADINQIVNYRATVTVKAGAENYALYDTMSAGLTFNNNVVVTVNGETVEASNYTVKTDVTGYTFVVEFKNEYIEKLTAGTEIIVTYSATLNENAVVGLPGNTNEVVLKYGDENDLSSTTKATTTTYTWDLNVIKYTMKDGADVKLANATFKLSTDEAGANVIKFHALGNNNYEVCVKTDCTKDHVTEITTDTTGTFHIEGLDAGTYYLTETAAPAGYNKLAGPVTITITGATAGENGALTYTTLDQTVLNQSGSELPDTGGVGTTMFYLFGGIMVLAAVVLLVTKKRMNNVE